MGALFSYERVIQMARNLTPLQAEYIKQEKRIKSFVRRATKRGFIFPENVIPKRPKRITQKAVERLREMTAPSLYKEAQYVEPSTGEVVSGYQGRKSERKRASKKGQRTRQQRKQRRADKYGLPEEPISYHEDTYSSEDFYADAVISNFKDILTKYNARGAGVLIKWIDELIFKYGKADVANMLETGANYGVIITYDVVYAEQLTRQYMADMVRYLSSMETEDAESYGQEFYDALEEDDGFSTY